MPASFSSRLASSGLVALQFQNLRHVPRLVRVVISQVLHPGLALLLHPFVVRLRLSRKFPFDRVCRDRCRRFTAEQRDENRIFPLDVDRSGSILPSEAMPIGRKCGVGVMRPATKN